VQEKIDTVLKEHGEWLLSLRLVDRSELGLLIGGLAGAVLSALAIVLGPVESSEIAIAAVLAGVGFFLAIVTITLVGTRHKNSVLYALVILSEANLVLAVFTGWPGVLQICFGIAITGMVSGVFILLLWTKVRLELNSVAGCTGRDDLKWLVTKAPLIVRVLILLQARKTAEQESG